MIVGKGYESLLRAGTSIRSNVRSVSLLRLSFRISPAVLNCGRSVPTDDDVAGIIKCDSCILYRLGRCNLCMQMVA